MRLVRVLLRKLLPPPPYRGEIPPLLYRLHPATGVTGVRPGQATDELPQWWRELPEDVWEEMLFDWMREVMRTVAERGEGTLYAEFSDRLGVEELRRLPECRSGPRGSLICDATPAALDALLRTNVSQFVQTVGGDAILYASSAWDSLFLCVEDEDLIERFREPATRRSA